MNRNQWLRGLAVSLSVTGIHGFSHGQGYIPPANGLAPSSFPSPYVPSYPSMPQAQMFVGSGSPYLAQNSSAPNSGHVHVPQGNYTAAGQPGSIPSVSGNYVQAQPSQTAPLPPVEYSTPVQSSHTSSVPSTAPIYQVPTQQYSAPQQYLAPQPVPMTQPLYQNGPTVSADGSAPCQSCNQTQGSVWSGYGGGPTSNASSCGGPSCYSGIATSYAGGVVAPKPWIFGGNALIFNRIDNDYHRLSINGSNTGPGILSTLDARMRSTGGFEVFGGRYFGCGKYAIIGSYWGLFPGDQTRTIYDPELNTGAGDTIRSSLPFTVRLPNGLPADEHGVEMPNGAPVLGPDGGRTIYAWYNNAYAHRLTRSQDYNNAEINLLSFGLGGAVRQGVAGGGVGLGCGAGQSGGWSNGRIGRGLGMGASQGGSCGDCGSCETASCNGCSGACAPIIGAQCSPFRFTSSAGLRWFRFNDNFNFATSDDATFDATDVYYRNNVRNDLVGLQLGGRLTYCTGRKVNLYGGTKFGVFGNRINYDSYIGNATTAAIVSSNDSYDNQAFNIQSSTTGLSLLGEGELGTGVRLSNCWTANAGYRVIGVSGIATAPGQIPYDFSLLNDVRRIHNHESLILHGVSFGAMYNW